MEVLFDPTLVAQRRRRAARDFDPKASFLLDLAAEEIAFRLMPVERRFEQAIELFGGTGAVGRAALLTGKVGTVTRAQVREIAELKRPDLSAESLEAAMRTVEGTARSVGLDVVD